MREFLVAMGFLSDVSAFSSAGKTLNDGCTTIESGGVSSLPASMAYIDQQNEIKALIDSYIALIAKDAKDLVEMQAEAARMDARLAGTLGSH